MFCERLFQCGGLCTPGTGTQLRGGSRILKGRGLILCACKVKTRGMHIFGMFNAFCCGMCCTTSTGVQSLYFLLSSVRTMNIIILEGGDFSPPSPLPGSDPAAKRFGWLTILLGSQSLSGGLDMWNPCTPFSADEGK